MRTKALCICVLLVLALLAVFGCGRTQPPGNLASGADILYGDGAEYKGSPYTLLLDHDFDTAVSWRIPNTTVLELRFPEPRRFDTMALRWSRLPESYQVEAHTRGAWKQVAALYDNTIGGPMIRLHLMDAIIADTLRIITGGAVTHDVHGRPVSDGIASALADIELYDSHALPPHIQALIEPSPPLYPLHLPPDTSRIPAEYVLTDTIPTWEPITRDEYVGTNTGRVMNEHANKRRAMLADAAVSYIAGGGDEYAERTVALLRATINHYGRHQAFRFYDYDWKAVTYQEPGYLLGLALKAYDAVRQTRSLTREDRLRYLYFILDVAEFQYRTLETHFNGRENWSANSIGELTLTALYFDGFPEAERWVARCDEKIAGCFDPFLEDGYWWEASPAHTVYQMRGLLKYGYAKHLLGEPVWDVAYNGISLEDAAESLAKTVNPFGEYPTINDSNAHDMPVLREHPEIIPPLYAMGRGDILTMLGANDDIFTTATGLTFGVTLTEPDYTSVLLPDAGIGILRDGWGRDDGYLLLDYGPHGGGHGHFDKLNFILIDNGIHWVPDGGCSPHYSIFPEQRSWHIQTVAHNTVMADSMSQAPGTGRLLLFATDDSIGAVGALFDEGYPGLEHRRTIIHPHDEYYLIHDRITSSGPEYSLDWLLHVYGVMSYQAPGKIVFRKGDHSLLVLSPSISTEAVPVEQGLCGGFGRGAWASEGFPQKGDPGWIYIPWIRLPSEVSRHTPEEYWVVLAPFQGDEPDISVREIDDCNRNTGGIVITHDGGTDVFLERADIRRGGVLRSDGHESSGDVLFVRKKGQDEAIRREWSYEQDH